MNTRYASLEELPGYDTVVLRVVLFRDFLWLVHAHPDRTGTAVGRAAPMNFLLLALYVRLPLRRAIDRHKPISRLHLGDPPGAFKGLIMLSNFGQIFMDGTTSMYV